MHKEINQTHTIDDKVIFNEAIHRNEMTGEQEGEDITSLYNAVKKSRW